MADPFLAARELCNRSFFYFFQYFWGCINSEPLSLNWHIKYLCDELQRVAERVAARKAKEYDLLINVPPGTSKTSICSIAFPVWCWTRWHWMRFITGSYASELSLEAAEHSRDILRSPLFMRLYPELMLRPDKDSKHNYSIVKMLGKSSVKNLNIQSMGGNRFSTSVGGAVTGFHGHMLLVDDPINPKKAVSQAELRTANAWMDRTLSTRKVDKRITPTILIMQRLHESDPTGHLLAKQKENLRHICLPADCNEYDVHPAELKQYYEDGLLDPVRMPRSVLREALQDLGQYGYAGQMGQRPTPPSGGMFKVDKILTVDAAPAGDKVMQTVRYWDKAGTADGGAYTAGVKMALLASGRYLVLDVQRQQVDAVDREVLIRRTAEADGQLCTVWVEQEPGSGGKESAQATIRNLAGFSVYSERPTGDKVYRADPYSVQVSSGNLMIMRASWNQEFIEEHRFFPLSKYKDQVDAAAGAFNKLVNVSRAGTW
jgi:predicted phage terminase large subunit-like protein